MSNAGHSPVPGIHARLLTDEERALPRPSPSELVRRAADMFEWLYSEHQVVKRPVASETCAYRGTALLRCGIAATSWRSLPNEYDLSDVLYPVCEGHRETS